MGKPKTPAEEERARATQALAQDGEVMASTACPECRERFTMLAAPGAELWYLRCTSCGWAGTGDLKLGKAP